MTRVRHMLWARYPVDLAGRPWSDGGTYPLDWRRHAPRHRDLRYVPMAHDGRLTYMNPVSVGLYGLARHSEFAYGGDPAARTAFLAQADALRRSQDANGGWRYPIPVARYGVAPGWYSGMAQGLAISVFLRAQVMTGSGDFLAAADRARDLMIRPTLAGGCAVMDADGRAFVEECPSEPPSLILNGASFALIGWLEMERSPGTAGAVDRLGELLPAFDNGFWSVYDLRFRASASYAYHVLHVSQLRVLFHLSHDERFLSTARRWHRYARDPRYRLRAAVEKSLFAIRHARS